MWTQADARVSGLVTRRRTPNFFSGEAWAPAPVSGSGDQCSGSQGGGLLDGLERCRWHGWHGGMVAYMHEGKACPMPIPPIQSSPIPSAFLVPSGAFCTGQDPLPPSRTFLVRCQVLGTFWTRFSCRTLDINARCKDRCNCPHVWLLLLQVVQVRSHPYSTRWDRMRRC